MSIKLATDCKDCVHEKVCKYKNNAVDAMNRFKSSIDGGSRWDDSMKNKHVDVVFSCPSFDRMSIHINGL